ncbi:hypothetical protein CgunFtcFv8_004563 [Champsocephalus gunnari]|uniref:Beta-microseminoprotein-like n=1 Tax=Champsocephalus gunnari TaxID=52237 RepID=A0AAN8EBP5_CHAGU|nr:hypothetical protein CgunFtcFv8_004563 [Champsocephalus gunnari]
MKYLALALLFCALASLSDASRCYAKALLPGMTHCQDDSDYTWHPVGSSWRNSECFDCSCTGCCNKFSTPIQFDPDCVSVFDSAACKYIAHKSNDPTQLCPMAQ